MRVMALNLKGASPTALIDPKPDPFLKRSVSLGDPYWITHKPQRRPFNQNP